MSNERNFDKELWEISEREQRLLAQELHDTLCQTLVGLSLLTKGSLRHLQSKRPVEMPELTRISEQLDIAIEQARFFMQPQLVAVRPAALVTALQDLARATSTQIPCEFHGDETAALTEPRVAQCFYRIARETMRNIIHTTQARRIIMSLAPDQDRFCMEITCDRADEANPSSLEGDGFLRRSAVSLGLSWEITSIENQSATLRFTFGR